MTPAGRRGRRLFWLVAGLAAAWLLPLLTHLAGVDWVVLLLIVTGGAVLLDSGTVLDRLVIGGTIVAGTTLAAAVLFTLWPWGLQPVAIGGVGLTTLVLVAWARPPRWQTILLGRPADLIVVGVPALLAFLVAWPMRGGGLAHRIGYIVRGEDVARHFGMTDTIRRIGGYVFMNVHDPIVTSSIQDVHRTYPQGFHMLAAIVDTFVTSSATAGDPTAALGRFLVYDVAAYAMMGLTISWAARRFAGPSASFWAIAPVCAAVLGFLFWGDLLGMFWRGFVPEVAGATFLLVLVGALIRPLPNTTQQFLLVGTTVVGVAFTYYFLLPLAAVLVLLWAVVARRRLRRGWRTGVAVAAVGAVVIAVPELYGKPQGALDMLVSGYAIDVVPLSPVVALGAVSGALVLLRFRGWLTPPSTLLAAAAMMAAAAMAAGIAAFQIARIGRTLYFFDKTLHIVIILFLVGLGAAAPLLERILRPGEPARSRLGALRRPLAGTALSLAVLASFGVIGTRLPVQPPSAGGNWGRAYRAGLLSSTPAARWALTVAKQVPNPQRKTVLLAIADADVSYTGSLFVAVLERDYGLTWPGYQWLAGSKKRPEDFEQMLLSSRDHFQIVIDSAELRITLGQFSAQHPELSLDIIDACALGQAPAC
jgi:hypothetical protein